MSHTNVYIFCMEALSYFSLRQAMIDQKCDADQYIAALLPLMKDENSSNDEPAAAIQIISEKTKSVFLRYRENDLVIS